MHGENAMSPITGGPKKNWTRLCFSYNFGYLADIISFLFNPLDTRWLCHWRKMSVIVVYFKMATQRDKRWKFLHFFLRDIKWVRSQTLSGCLGQPFTQARSARTMTKVSTEVQAVIERQHLDNDSLRDAIRSSPRTSMRQHARRFGFGAATVRRAVAKLGAKSRVIVPCHPRSKVPRLEQRSKCPKVLFCLLRKIMKYLVYNLDLKCVHFSSALPVSYYIHAMRN